MKDKEKQIEEMAKMIDDRLIEASGYLGSMNRGEGYWIAQKLVEHYQPKIPEDCVVLSKAKYEMLVACSSYEGVMSKLKDEYVRGSKETAEKCNSILEKNYKDWLKVLNDLKIDTSNKNILVSIVCGLFKNSQEEIAKQFGVEVDK